MRPHVSIDVKDLGRSVEFYKKIFAQDPQKQSGGYAKFDLHEPPLNFSMQCHNGIPASHVGHFGIEVDSLEQLAQWRERLQAAGLAQRVETQTACCFARQDKVWFEDPDGNAWEVFYVYEQLPVNASSAMGPCCP